MGLNGANSKRLTELRGPRYAGLVRRSRQLPQILGDIVAIALTNDDNMFGGAVIPIATRILVWNWVKNILVAVSSVNRLLKYCCYHRLTPTT